MSAKTLSNISGCIMAFMKYCKDVKATSFVPDPLTIPNGARKSEKSVATKKDIETLFSKTTTILRGKEVEDIYIHAYRFSVLCGMRPGERTALKNEDISGNIVTISESINDEEEVTPGKNENAHRTYKLDYHALKVLQDQRDMLKRLGWITPYVFPDYDLSYIPQDKFRKHWKRFCASNGMSGTTPYELRHTWVSVNKKMPDGLKKLVVGHSKDMDTDGQYGHEMEGDMDEAAEYVGEAFKQILGW
jgi:integrase